MVLTLVLLAIGALLFLTIAYNIFQQHKQQQEIDRRAIVARQKVIIEEAEDILLNVNRLSYSKTLVMLLQNRLLDALRTIQNVTPNVSAINQRIEDVRNQIKYVNEHYKGEDSHFRSPDSDRQAIQMLQTTKKLRAIVRMEHNKGKIDPQSFSVEDRRLELMLLKINIANLLQKAMDARVQRQIGTAKQLLTKGINALSVIPDKDAYLIASEEEMKSTLRDINDQLERESQKEREEIQEKQDDLDVLFQPKKKW
ncbi:DNA repair protein [uncultured Tolumonas sp.]|uniref:DNA repair protein n=1 Tax=uncultured Tolumonas sp. TaxID=263765 RepID=UPI002A0A6DC9|nr:DNA repair protein [uncultured Tolumonas sp.]